MSAEPKRKNAARRRLATAGAALAASALLGILWIVDGQVDERWETVPALSMPTIDGGHFDVGAERGGPAVVNFWASSCAVCLREMPQLIAFADAHPETRFVAVVMPYDPPNRAIDAAARLGIPFPVALDVDGRANRAFGSVAATPTTVVVDRAGRVRYRVTGPVDFAALGRVVADLAAASG